MTTLEALGEPIEVAFAKNGVSPPTMVAAATTAKTGLVIYFFNGESPFYTADIPVLPWAQLLTPGLWKKLHRESKQDLGPIITPHACWDNSLSLPRYKKISSQT